MHRNRSCALIFNHLFSGLSQLIYKNESMSQRNDYLAYINRKHQGYLMGVLFHVSIHFLLIFSLVHMNYLNASEGIHILKEFYLFASLHVERPL